MMMTMMKTDRLILAAHDEKSVAENNVTLLQLLLVRANLSSCHHVIMMIRIFIEMIVMVIMMIMIMIIVSVIMMNVMMIMISHLELSLINNFT